MWDSGQCILLSLWHDHNGYSWIIRISVAMWRCVGEKKGLKQAGHSPACPRPTLQSTRHMMGTTMKCSAHLWNVFWLVVNKRGLLLVMDYASKPFQTFQRREAKLHTNKVTEVQTTERLPYMSQELESGQGVDIWSFQTLYFPTMSYYILLEPGNAIFSLVIF